jgi:hypothetical protein
MDLLKQFKEDIQVCEEQMEELTEMANAPQKYTGISGVVYFCTKEEMSNTQSHALGRVKLIKDGEDVSCSIKKNDAGEYVTRGKNERLLKSLIKFVEQNEDILWTYWNTPAMEADSAEAMRSFQKI